MKAIPDFKSEAEMRNFWLNNDSTDYIDWSKAKRVKFTNLQKTDFTECEQPDKKRVSLILDEKVIAHFKTTGKGWQQRINDVLRKELAV